MFYAHWREKHVVATLSVFKQRHHADHFAFSRGGGPGEAAARHRHLATCPWRRGVAAMRY